MIQHIFLDMDGVLTDFMAAALKLHGHDRGLQGWPVGERDVAKVLGISRGEFWKKIDDEGCAFWAGLQPYPWFLELIELVDSVAPFSVLTSPSLSPDCLKGKTSWLYEHFPKRGGKSFRDFLIGEQKYLLAQPQRVLIDDTESHITAFERAQGAGILFPQIWNRNHEAKDPVEYVRRELTRLNTMPA